MNINILTNLKKQNLRTDINSVRKMLIQDSQGASKGSQEILQNLLDSLDELHWNMVDKIETKYEGK